MINSGDITILTGKFVISLLIFVRISGMMAVAPFFSNSAIPMQLKMLFSMILSIIITTAFWKHQPVIDFDVWNLLLLVFKELLVGISIGFAANLVFWGASFAGGMIDFDMGFQAATLFNQEDSAPSLTGEFFGLATLMLFFIVNGHHYIIQSIFASIKAVPLTKMEFTDSTIKELARMATSVLMIGIKIASPIIIALFLTNLSLSLLARIAPQTNIFVLSFQIKVVVGMLTLIASTPLMIWVIKFFLDSMENELMRMIMSLNPGRV